MRKLEVEVLQKDDSEEKIEREKVEQDTEGVVVVVGYWMKKNRERVLQEESIKRQRQRRRL